ncbi:MAG TPA: GntR family transcriptional regulator [Nocardioidaceae bacterium]|nr:GntR family transcriptional regulator [Nocardioidaceae bacterium]
MTSPSGTAKHIAIRDQLRETVLRLAPGQPLPAERQLAEQWGVARMTVRQAIAALAREGLVRSVHGRGNLRSPEPLQLRIQLGSFADAVREHDLEPTTRPLECGIDENPPEVVTDFLGLGGGQRALRVRRLRLGNGVPLALERTWFAADLVPDLTERDLTGSLYHYLEARGLLPDSGEEAVVAGLPEPHEVGLLDISASRPVLRLVRKALVGERAVEYAEAVFPADRCELWFPLQSR